MKEWKKLASEMNWRSNKEDFVESLWESNKEDFVESPWQSNKEDFVESPWQSNKEDFVESSVAGQQGKEEDEEDYFRNEK